GFLGHEWYGRYDHARLSARLHRVMDPAHRGHRGIPGRRGTGCFPASPRPAAELVRPLALSFWRRHRAGVVAVAFTQRGGADHRARHSVAEIPFLAKTSPSRCGARTKLSSAIPGGLLAAEGWDQRAQKWSTWQVASYSGFVPACDGWNTAVLNATGLRFVDVIVRDSPPPLGRPSSGGTKSKDRLPGGHLRS